MRKRAAPQQDGLVRSRAGQGGDGELADSSDHGSGGFVRGMALTELRQDVLGVFKGMRQKESSSPPSFRQGCPVTAKSHTCTGRPSEARSLAKEANAEADMALQLDPLDAACHVLKSLALEQQGLFPAALRAMDVSLSPHVAKGLSASEMADALMKRGGLLLSSSKGHRNLDAAIADFQKSLEMSPEIPKVLCMLGLSFKKNRSYADVEKSYERALAVNSKLDERKVRHDEVAVVNGFVL